MAATAQLGRCVLSPQTVSCFKASHHIVNALCCIHFCYLILLLPPVVIMAQPFMPRPIVALVLQVCH